MTLRGSFFLITLLLLIFTPSLFISRDSQKQNKLISPLPSTAPQPQKESKVLGIANQQQEEEKTEVQEEIKETVTTPSIPFVECIGPDGKTAYAPQKDCDNVQKFWGSQSQPTPNNAPSSNNAPQTGSSPGTSSTTVSSPASPTPQATPTNSTPTPTTSMQPDDEEEEDKDNHGKKKKKKKKKDN